MVGHPARILGAAQPLRGREAEGEGHAGGDRLAVEQAIGEPRFGFQRMTESVAEVEQRAPPARLAFILADDAGLCRHALADRLEPRFGCAAEQLSHIGFAPGEEGHI